MPPTDGDIHPFDQVTRAMRVKSRIPLWGFGMCYDGSARFTFGADASSIAMRLKVRVAPMQPDPGAMCAAVLFDRTGSRYDLLRIGGDRETTSMYFPAAENPYPPPGVFSRLWTAAITLDPAHLERFASPVREGAGTDHDFENGVRR